MDDVDWLQARNDLERALLDAASDPDDAMRTSAFYAALTGSELFVVADVSGPVEIKSGESTLPPGTLVTPRTAAIGGGEVMPVYSSKERIDAATGGDLPYVAVPAREILAHVPDEVKVVLNPGVWHGKELWPEEIRALLADVAVPEGVASPKTDDAGQIAIGHPAEYPQEVADRLGERFVEHPSVVAGYLAVVGLPGSPPALTVGLEMKDPSALEAVVGLIGATIEEIGTEPLDVVEIEGNVVGDWMKANTEPFYRAAEAEPGRPDGSS